jgi:NADH:ubiquinone oxidoreductase subunit 2 (subunit N)
MTLLALLVVGVMASAGSAWGLARGGTAARVGAVGGVLALVAIAILALASPTPGTLTPDDSGAVAGTLWNGALVPGAYMRLVVVLWAATSVVVSGMAWLLRGITGLRGLLPASLAALVGAAVTLTAATPVLGVVAGGATGLASIPVVLATPRAAATGIAAREVRNAVGTSLVLVAVASVAPVLSRVVLADPESATLPGGSGAVAAVSFGLLAMAVILAARLGGIPYHVRVSAIADVAPSGALPLIVAWLPLPLAAATVGVSVGLLAPLAPPVGSAQAVIVAATLLATLAACLVAFVQDDLRHAVGYLTIADLGLVIVALAALDSNLWGPARTWLLTVAVTKTALASWATVVEDRFETRSVPDLRGWLRPSPVLGIALALTVLATYGLPGWAVMTARTDLTHGATGSPWGTMLLLASFMTLPAYLRWLWLGIGASSSHVDRSVPELSGSRIALLSARRIAIALPRRNRADTLPVEQETSDGVAAGRTEPSEGAGGKTVAAPGARAVKGKGGRAPKALPAVGEGDGGADSVLADVLPSSGASGRRRAASRRAAASTMATSSAPAATTRVALSSTTVGDQGAPDGAPPRELRSHRSPRPDAAPRVSAALARHRTGVLSGAVLALALLASLVAVGTFGVTAAAGEPTPAVAGVSTAGG